MRVLDLRSDDLEGGVRRVSAQVVWEGSHRGPTSLWYEAAPPWAADLEPSAEAFATAALPLAAGLGEQRLLVEAPLCPRLRAGLVAASERLAAWWPGRCHAVPVEAAGDAALAPRTPARRAVFLSGGVDSLAWVRRAQREDAADPGRDPAGPLRDAVLLYGWHTEDFVGQAVSPERWRVHEERHARLSAYCQRKGLALGVVRTNARTFHPWFRWSLDIAYGAGMLSTAHALARRLTHVDYASSGLPGDPAPLGSRPDLDPLFSSSAVEVRHADEDRTRLAKIRDLCHDDDALAVLEVCLRLSPGAPGEVSEVSEVNCGRCKKCLRTRLAFLALGALPRAATFPHGDLRPGDFRHLTTPGSSAAAFFRDLEPALEAVGRHDLVRAIRAVIRRSQRKARRRASPLYRWWKRLRGRT